MRASKHKYTGWSKRVERNILACYLRASEDDRAEGLTWYQTAHNDAVVISKRLGVTIPQVIGVIAALSPGLNWGLNILQADELISAYVKGARDKDLPLVGAYGMRNIIKAQRILNGEIPLDVLGGDKVRSFYQNILYPQDIFIVTVDRHARALAYNESSKRSGFASVDKTITSKEYDYLGKHFYRVAAHVGLLPSQLQAITWITWRRLKGNLDQETIPF